MARDAGDAKGKQRERERARERKMDKTAQAHSVFVRLVLPPYTIHFKSPTYMRDTTLDLLDRKVCKPTLITTASDPAVRQAIGTDRHFWADLVLLFHAAIPSLERRSFTIWDPSSVDYESTSGALIASHYPTLWKDLERLNDLVSISRNVLTIGSAAQDLAAYESLDHEVFRLINCCVRVTARGYDGEAGTGDEEKWQWVVNAYKKLLITSLQFLNNLVAQNERRKLMLWLSLFDHEKPGDEYNGGHSSFSADDIPETSRTSMADVPSNPSVAPEPPLNHDDILLAYGVDPTGRTIPRSERERAARAIASDALQTEPYSFPADIQSILSAAHSRGDLTALVGTPYAYFGKKLHNVRCIPNVNANCQNPGQPTLAEEHEELKRQWSELGESDKDHWEGLYSDVAAKYRADLAVWDAKQIMLLRDGDEAVTAKEGLIGERQRELRDRVRELEVEIAEHLNLTGQDLDASPEILRSRYAAETRVGGIEGGEVDRELTGVLHKEDLRWRATVADDVKMGVSAAAGRRILESGKGELLKRLGGYRRSETEPGVGAMHADGGRSEDVVRMRGDGMARSLSAGAGARISEQEADDSTAVVRPGGSQPGARARTSRGRVAVREQAPVVDTGEEDLGSEMDGDEEPEGSEEGDEDDEEEGVEGDEEPEEDERRDDEEEEEEEEEDEDEDYPGSTEDGRGLLTDVPLILGPSEIEVLPMLIMSGIVPPPATSQPNGSLVSAPLSHNAEHLTQDERHLEVKNAHTLRTHLLLSQSTGRNLLRELLIFVAAWDLREEELYFKFMVKILEGILDAGLLPYAYHSFRDRSRSKDIISPAQAVMVKLVTVVYRGRGGAKRVSENGTVADERYWAAKRRATASQLLATRVPTEEDDEDDIDGSANDRTGADPKSFNKDSGNALHHRHHALLLLYPPPSRTDLHTLNFLFTEFRQHIVPQTCALIFLQSQIHAGRAGAEDFPLNLWDMERMSEGVYQFLEFLAVVCEDGGGVSANGIPGAVATDNGNGSANGAGNGWGKAVLAEWEAACELVALLRELEGGSEKRDGAMQLRYGKGVAIGSVSPALAAQRRAMALQAQHAAQAQQYAMQPQLPRIMPLPMAQQQRSLSADAAIPASGRQQGLYPGGSLSSSSMGERPMAFDDLRGSVELPPLSATLPSMLGGGLDLEPGSIFEAETPLAYPEDMVGMGMGMLPPHQLGAVHPPLHLPPLAGGEAVGGGVPVQAVPDQDHPSDFEWRNLKKLTVLVLSSLVWKNPKVQDQVREYGGLEALVSCCRPEGEESNPYIREHAIMCLRFAVEGNEENVAVMRGLVGQERGKDDEQFRGPRQKVAKRGREEQRLLGGPVPMPSSTEDVGREGVVREVLDQGGYETFLDGKGQVGLRRKADTALLHPSQPQAYGSAAQGQHHLATATPPAEKAAHTLPSTTSAVGGGPSSSNSGISKPAAPRLSPARLTAEKAAELMQNALRDLPLGDKLVTDKQKAEALAKLDRAFESTEQALRRGTAGGGNGYGGGGSGGGGTGKKTGGGGGA
ncbi:hypothetical protein B0A54_12803 [Friedmanniomyces endolithicus]|uniref:Ataxin-10 homolog n=1 Tax=Friedmanniomyces endolithicus TaxID=329885 RepID=A0A4U0UKC4_9PEZI|nr:hypothetical protein LTS09_012933 [Friedmanniomyces endolithicus]TKA36173.1 hypothetical protein B0A54_12803 [Friedmanniomyces endolithicus]